MANQQVNIIPLKWLVEDNYSAIMRFLSYDKSASAMGFRTVLTTLNNLWYHPHMEWQLAKEKLHVGMVGRVPGCGAVGITMGVAAQLRSYGKRMVILHLCGNELTYTYYYVDEDGIISLVREFIPLDVVDLSLSPTEHKLHLHQFMANLVSYTPISTASGLSLEEKISPNGEISPDGMVSIDGERKSSPFEDNIIYAIAENVNGSEEMVAHFFQELGALPAIGKRYIITPTEAARLEFLGTKLTYIQAEEEEFIDPMKVIGSLGIDCCSSRLVMEITPNQEEVILHSGGTDNPVTIAGLYPTILDRLLERNLFRALAIRIDKSTTPILALVGAGRSLLDENSTITEFLYSIAEEVE